MTTLAIGFLVTTRGYRGEFSKMLAASIPHTRTVANYYPGTLNYQATALLSNFLPLIVVADSLLVQPMYYYAPPQVASRIVFPLDFKLIERYKHEDSLEQNYWAGRRIFPVPIVSLDKLRDNPDYLVVASNGNWLLQKFEVDGSPAAMLPIATNSHDIGGFTPLSHGETYFFEIGNPLQWDQQYARKLNTFSNWNRDTHSHAPSSGMQQ